MEFPPVSRYAVLAVVFLSVALILPSTAQSTSFTQTCIITGQVTTPDNCIASSIPYMAIGVMLSFMVIAIVYMIGNVMNFKPMQDWYRAELWESIKTVLMIGIIISSMVMMSAVADIMVGVPQPAHPGVAGALSTNLAYLYNADNIYVSNQLTVAEQAYAAQLGLSLGSGILKSTTLSLWLPIPLFWPFPPIVFGSAQFGISSSNIFKSEFTSLVPGDTSAGVTQNLTGLVIIPMLIAFQLQSSYFYFIVTLGLGILIPIGIIFRAFPLMRDIGGTLIATGVGLALIYPALLLLVNMPISNYIYAFTYSQTLSSSCPFSSGLICKGWSAMITIIAQPNVFSGIAALSGSPDAAAATAGLPVGTTALAKFPLLLALGSGPASDANVVGAMYRGVAVGLGTPLVYGVYPTLNFIIDETLGMILQFILLAIDILVGVIIVGAITRMLGGKVRLGFGRKLGLTTG